MSTDTGTLPNGTEDVSVIIPTLVEQHRLERLQRWIASIRDFSVNHCKIIAVVNESRSPNEVVQWLREQNEIRLTIELPPSAPRAVRIGRDKVQTPFFYTLDDDDEYLPGSTDRKLSALQSHSEADSSSPTASTTGTERMSASTRSFLACPLIRSVLCSRPIDYTTAMHSTAASGSHLSIFVTPIPSQNGHDWHTAWHWVARKLSRSTSHASATTAHLARSLKSKRTEMRTLHSLSEC